MDVVASPSVRAHAVEKGVDLGALAASIGRGRIELEDIDLHLKTAAAANDGQVAKDARFWEVDHSRYGAVAAEPLSRMALVAADNLSAANRMIPQVTHNDEADLTAIEGFRTLLGEEARARGVKLTALAFQVKALAKCLARFPRFNASLSADGLTLVVKHYVNVGIAVDTPAGLVVPVIRNAGRKGLWALAGEIADLALKGKERKLRPEDFGGASMSISNLGAIGGTGFTPIINPPELAILGISRASTRPRWTGESWEPVAALPLSLSYDHRVINGAEAARFLAEYAGLLGDPRRMLI